MAEAVEVKPSPRGGRGLFARSSKVPGDVVLVEKPVAETVPFDITDPRVIDSALQRYNARHAWRLVDECLRRGVALDEFHIEPRAIVEWEPEDEIVAREISEKHRVAPESVLDAYGKCATNMLIARVGRFGSTILPVSYGLYALGCMINHECRANADLLPARGGELVVVAKRPIAEGDEILINYLGPMSEGNECECEVVSQRFGFVASCSTR